MAPDRRVPVLDLFSGIGGFSRALRHVARTVAYCEVDKPCQAVLGANMRRGWLDEAPVFEDVRELGAASLRAARVPPPAMITAGFPCTDISVAGNGRGLAGAHSSLFHQIPRLLRELPSVKHVLLENSPAIRTRGLDEVVRALRAAGMTHIAYVFGGASDVGALHKRKRWVCLATRAPAALPAFSGPALAAALRWDWMRATRMPRMLPRTGAPGEHRDQVRRCQRLGNAVVPPFITHAYHALSQGVRSAAAITVAAAGCSGAELRGASGVVHVLAPGVGKGKDKDKGKGKDKDKDNDKDKDKDKEGCAPGLYAKRAANTVLMRVRAPSGRIMERSHFPTPVFNSQNWYGTRISCKRNLSVFLPVLLNDLQHPIHRGREGVMINAEFVETLMGYPAGWTRA